MVTRTSGPLGSRNLSSFVTLPARSHLSVIIPAPGAHQFAILFVVMQPPGGGEVSTETQCLFSLVHRLIETPEQHPGYQKGYCVPMP